MISVLVEHVVVVIIPDLHAATEGNIKTRVKAVVDTGKKIVRRRIAVIDLGVVNKSEAIFCDQSGGGPYQKPELVSERVLEAILELAYNVVVVIRVAKSLTANGGEARSPRVAEGELVHRKEVVLTLLAKSNVSKVERLKIGS